MTTIDAYSLVTVPLEPMFNDTSLGVATGFIWKSGERFYLITNWHVVTGRNFLTGENLSPHGGRPNKLRALFNPKSREFGKHQVDILIRNDDGEPDWLVYPLDRKLDVVAVPLPAQINEQLFALNAINTASSQNLAVGVGMDVFILGYPFGAEPPGFPVWKRGSIASEPELARLTTDYFLVDTASRPGMSGAPVIRRSWGSHLLANGGADLAPNAYTRFVGVYSGRRVGKDEADAQLGIVWPAVFVDDIIAGNTRDQD
jgi:hypothetical protein